MTLLEAALDYREAGWQVIPITPGDKAPPLLASWLPYQKEYATYEEVEEWWTRWPTANIGIVTGNLSGLTVVDVDGEEGEQILRELHLPQTYTVRTPRPHGFHLYYHYQAEARTGAKRLPGIDLRSEGGYVVAPPSARAGGAYRVVRNIRIDWFPPLLLAELSETASKHDPAGPGSPQEPREWVAEALRGVPEERRNDTATRLAGYFHRKGLGESVILELMEGFAHRCSPPMNIGELRQTVRSVLRYPGGGTGTAPTWGGADGAQLFR